MSRSIVSRLTSSTATLAGAVVLIVTAPGRGFAQAPRQTRENFNAWFTAVGENRLSERWYFDYDIALRRSGPVKEMQSFLPRFGMRYQLNPAVRLTGGYAFSEVWPYGKLPSAFRTPEHRLWEQLQINHAVGRVALSHRYRIEQRWIGHVVSEDGEEHVQNWVRTNRFRYRFQGTVPLSGKTLDDGEFYVSGYSELFVGWGANVQYNVFDQNRTALSIGRRFSEKLRMEVGYLEQLIEKSNGRQLERNHTLTFSVYPSLSFWHDPKKHEKD